MITPPLTHLPSGKPRAVSCLNYSSEPRDRRKPPRPGVTIARTAAIAYDRQGFRSPAGASDVGGPKHDRCDPGPGHWPQPARSAGNGEEEPEVGSLGQEADLRAGAGRNLQPPLQDAERGEAGLLRAGRRLEGRAADVRQERD